MLQKINLPNENILDNDFDKNLRPTSLDNFIGQSNLKEILSISIEAAKFRNEPLDHILFYGPPGLGKTTLSNIIAKEMNTEIKTTSAPVLEKASDLAGILTNLQRGNVFFVDEIHRLGKIIEEYLYPAVEDFIIEIIVDSGTSARTLKINVEPFTLVGSTTRAGMLSAPLRDRFGIVLRLDYYNQKEISQIIKRSANLLKIEIELPAIDEIAKRSRGTPRIANRLLRRVRDYAQIKNNGIITGEITKKTMSILNVDEMGLEEMDKKILKTIMENFRGGPVGLKSIAMFVGEDEQTIEEIYEPYLIQIGFLERTMQGRKVTAKAYKYFNIPLRNNTLF